MRLLKTISSAAIATIAFAACRQDGNPHFRKVETHFSTYLQAHFHQSLPQDSTYYMLINEDGCLGCIQRTANHFLNDPRCTFIYSLASKERFFKEDAVASPQFKARMLIDSTGKINRLRYNNGNIGVLAVSHGHIDTMYALDATNTEATLSHLK